jgi:hypothetical protein
MLEQILHEGGEGAQRGLADDLDGRHAPQGCYDGESSLVLMRSQPVPVALSG